MLEFDWKLESLEPNCKHHKKIKPDICIKLKIPSRISLQRDTQCIFVPTKKELTPGSSTLTETENFSRKLTMDVSDALVGNPFLTEGKGTMCH